MISDISDTMFNKNNIRHADFTLTSNSYGTLVLYDATGWADFFDSRKDIVITVLPISPISDEIYTLGWNSIGKPWVKVTTYNFSPLEGVSRNIRVYTMRVL